jgi:hypothetical protein
MSQTTLNYVAISDEADEKPGLFQGWTSGRDRRKSDALPLAITLPVVMVISAALWVGIILAIRALF